ncbi:hypothetical protein, partial [Vibrio mediterranei]|uniref:hypothetical protein n=1 Tax=Vibrio mediterranei TaxID=689 RepID=UPI00148BAD28
MKYVYHTILLFGVVEVLLNVSTPPFYQFLLAFELLILFSSLLIPIKHGLTLIAGILCVSYGPWVYVVPDALTPENFYNISFLGLSVYTIVTFLFVFKIIYTSVFFKSGINEKILISKEKEVFLIFCLVFFCFSFLFSILFGEFFELIYDIRIYMPLFVFGFIFHLLESKDIQRILTWSIRIYIVQLLFSIALGASFDYAYGVSYLPVSNIGILFVILLFSSLISISLFERFLYFAIFCCLIFMGFLFVNGKVIMLFLFFVIAIMTKYRVASMIFLVVLLFLPVTFELLDAERFAILAYKLEQVLSIFSSGISISSLPINSVNNIIVELYTYYLNILYRPGGLIFGYGIGGGLYDYGNVLILWKDNGAYSNDFIETGNYLKFHLAIIDILVKFGSLSLILLYYILKFSRRNILDLVAVLSVIFIFSTSSK